MPKTNFTAEKRFNKPFYYRLIHIESIFINLHKLKLSDKEEKELWDLIEQMIHVRVLDTILQNLAEDKQDQFLQEFTVKPDEDRLIKFIRENIADIDIRLETTMNELEETIVEDFKII